MSFEMRNVDAKFSVRVHNPVDSRDADRRAEAWVKSVWERGIATTTPSDVQDIALVRVFVQGDAFGDRPATYDDALDNLTAENWHTERKLIEAEVGRYRAALRTALRDLLEGEAKPCDDEAVTHAETDALRVASLTPSG